MLASLLRVVVCLGLLGACAPEIPPPLSAEQRAKYAITRVETTFEDDAYVWWGEGDRTVARAAGINLEDGTAAGQYVETPEGKAALRALLQSRIAPPLERTISGALEGTAPAQVTVVITQFIVPSSAQLLVIGGGAQMQGVVQVFDLDTGAALLARTEVLTLPVPKKGGIIGAIANAVDSGQEVDLAQGWASLARHWLRLSAPGNVPDIVGSSEPLPPIPAPTPGATATVPQS